MLSLNNNNFEYRFRDLYMNTDTRGVENNLNRMQSSAQTMQRERRQEQIEQHRRQHVLTQPQQAISSLIDRFSNISLLSGSSCSSSHSRQPMKRAQNTRPAQESMTKEKTSSRIDVDHTISPLTSIDDGIRRLRRMTLAINIEAYDIASRNMPSNPLSSGLRSFQALAKSRCLSAICAFQENPENYQAIAVNLEQQLQQQLASLTTTETTSQQKKVRRI